jgi:hypothetical protein
MYVMVAQSKWDRVKGILAQYMSMIECQADSQGILLDRKLLEQDVGFLVHICMTYENLRPFLKGFHLSLNSWRFDRHAKGWMLDRSDWEESAIALYDDA